MLHRFIAFPAVVAVLLLVAAPLRAQIVAPSGRTLFNRNVLVRCFAKFDYFDEPVAGLNVRAYSFPCAVVWGVRRDTSLIFAVPAAVLDIDQKTGNSTGSKTQAGLADSQLIVQYDGFYRKNVRKGYTRIGGQFGVKLPTGRSGFSSDSVDFLFTAIFSRVRDRHWLVADSQFTLTTENDARVKQGNRWNLDLVYLYRLLPLHGLEGKNLFAVLEANGELVNRTRVHNVPTANTGGSVLFLSPGLEFLPTQRVVLEFSLPVAVARDLNGPQLKPTFSVIAGIRLLF